MTCNTDRSFCFRSLRPGSRRRTGTFSVISSPSPFIFLLSFFLSVSTNQTAEVALATKKGPERERRSYFLFISLRVSYKLQSHITVTSMFTRIGRVCLPTKAALTQCRYLNIHEYQSKALLKEGGCKTEFGVACSSIEEVEAALGKIKGDKKVVKSQILAGGRGMGTFVDGFKGGVHVCKDAAEALACARRMLNNTLVTKQTGPKGQKVSRLYVTEAISGIKRELYLALLLDRKTASPVFIGSAEGGMGIEELAQKQPDKIKKMRINVQEGINHDNCLTFAHELGFTGRAAENAAEQIKALYNVGKSKDCTMVEINPLVELENGDVMCIDAKLSFDDNAEFRQHDIFALADATQIDPKEVVAKKYDLNYIALDGNVGCLVNGAGLAMATMDLISHGGGKPANFLDVGGSATKEQIVAAFEIITGDEAVRSILVNIFGGIMRCDTIAEGIVAASRMLKSKGVREVPVVVRLSGSKEEEGKRILKESGLPLHPAQNFEEAAALACKLAA
ncbi:succinyl-CoA ligase [GDP-forming] beta-chain, putative [Trypanosoma brucei brucei TREU927]|uniref:Succinate--CoA ligase [ADP-forming] subunit beta, mitochondrial n=1 Tax=Trypanosoma brucei brucei (strain 927/4 GUTat10.1) TaxID=185431 RepID=Q38AM2_TRYB2|nr:succinyl-CoA ligase [GDP-forming] beta-chain, putative [Trypanosoma brucei brucei TREU927]EAN78148.1 succinyl-CoA ligase [GDP-forming] beta-chain, putative [Trypanosoma brucei brucei TREU927]